MDAGQLGGGGEVLRASWAERRGGALPEAYIANAPTGADCIDQLMR